LSAGQLPVFNLRRDRIFGFSPQGRHVASFKVKYGVEVSRQAEQQTQQMGGENSQYLIIGLFNIAAKGWIEQYAISRM